jgi:hypothetical protein
VREPSKGSDERQARGGFKHNHSNNRHRREDATPRKRPHEIKNHNYTLNTKRRQYIEWRVCEERVESEPRERRRRRRRRRSKTETQKQTEQEDQRRVERVTYRITPCGEWICENAIVHSSGEECDQSDEKCEGDQLQERLYQDASEAAMGKIPVGLSQKPVQIADRIGHL